LAKKKTGLGRGLNALIPDIEKQEREDKPSKKNILDIDANLIKTNPNQPRKHFDKSKIDELALSVKRHGIMQPVIVMPDGDGYIIVAGERRYRAARKAELKSVPCIIREVGATESMELALIENLQREDLNPIEEAMAFRQLMDEHGMTQEKVSFVAGKSRPYIANMVRLLGLDEKTRKLVVKGDLSGGHARTLLGLASEEKRALLAKKIIKNGWSVREAEKQVKNMLSEKQKKPYTAEREEDSEISTIEEALRERFATKVNIKNGKKNRGKIEISYHGLDEFERIMKLLKN